MAEIVLRRGEILSSDVSAVLTADLEERLGDLLQAAHPGGVHQDGEHVAARARRFLQVGQGRVGFLAVPFGEIPDPFQLGLLLLLGGPGQLGGGGHGTGRVPERIDPDQRQRAVVLALLVQHGLVLDPAALVAGLHRAQHPAARADRLELGQHGLFHQVGELIDDERALQRARLKLDTPHPKVLRITMDNGKLNTADGAMHAELARIWRDLDADPDINAAIITGAGAMFSAGGDFRMIEGIMRDFEARTRAWREARDIVYNIINCGKPIVSAMRGVAVGAGLVCGLLADVSIASKECRIIDGHTRLGVAAGDHAAIIWPLLCGMAKAKYYLLLCDQLLGAEAERIGLVSLAVEDAELDGKAVEIATRLAEGAQSAIRWTKYSLNNWLRQAGPAFDTSLALEMLGFTGPEAAEGLAAHLEKRKPAFPPSSGV